MDKATLRREALARRDSIPEKQRKMAEAYMTERIIGHQWFYLAETVLIFVSYKTEINTMEIIEEAWNKRKKVYAPKIIDGRMEFFRIYSKKDLQEGYKGIFEPIDENEKFEYRASEMDKTLMLMPGVAFDRFYHRIGYGKGFYDCYLSKYPELRNKTIAIGFKCQLVEDFEPDEFDIKPYQVILC